MAMRPSHKPGTARSLSHRFLENTKPSENGGTARGAGRSDVGDCQRCKTIQTPLKYRTFLVLNLSGDSRVGVWRTGGYRMPRNRDLERV